MGMTHNVPRVSDIFVVAIKEPAGFEQLQKYFRENPHKGR
jgi:hypothetical protein